MSVLQFSLATAAPTVGPVLAAGAWFHNAACAVRGNEVSFSSLVGDLSTPEACIGHEVAMQTLIEWAGPPKGIAHDLHPDFPSTRLALELAGEWGIPACPVAHHQAHVAAICAEKSCVPF